MRVRVLFSIRVTGVFESSESLRRLFDWVHSLLIEEWCPFELKNPSLGLSLRSDLEDAAPDAAGSGSGSAAAPAGSRALAGGAGGGARSSTPPLTMSSTLDAAGLSPKVVFNFQWDKAVVADLDVAAATSVETRATRERLDRFVKDELRAVAIVL